MRKKTTVLTGTVLMRGNTPIALSPLPFYLLQTHFFNCVTVLTELITHHCVTVLPPIYKAVLTQWTNPAEEEAYEV